VSLVGVFHPSEPAVQPRAGVRSRAERTGAMIGSSIDAADRRFLSELTFVIVGGVDERGRMWVILLLGPPGFILASESHLQLKARPHHDDPLAGMRPGAAIGPLAIDPLTRRRLRVNGQLTRSTASGFELQPDQVYRTARSASRPAPLPRCRRPAANAPDLRPQRSAMRSNAGSLPPTPSSSPPATQKLALTPHTGEECPDSSPSPTPTASAFPTTSAMTSSTRSATSPRRRRQDCCSATSLTGTRSLTGTAHVDWDPARSQRHPGAQRVVDVKIDAVIQAWRTRQAVVSSTAAARVVSASRPLSAVS